MRRPPELKEFARYPVTSGVALLAVVVTIAWWAHWDIAPLVEYGPKLWREPWRLLTSALPHASVFHLLFNLYWIWVFGTLLEQQFGHLRYAGLLVLLAAGSGAAEFAVMSGGVGLSGVGYGLFGMLWVLSLFDRRFSDAVDRNTILLFVLWFFLCIVLTVVNVMPVANVAHGAGAALGALVGWVYVARSRRAIAVAALAAALAVIAWGASVGRTLVNMSVAAGDEYGMEGYEALARGQPAQAVNFYQQALQFRKKDPSSYYNLGVSYMRLHDVDNAVPCFRAAARADPADAHYRQVLAETQEYQQALAGAASHPATGPSMPKN